MPRLGPFTNRLDLIAPVQWYAGMRRAPHPRLAECDQGSWVNISHTTIKHGYSGEAPDKSSALPSVDYFSKSISDNWQLQTCILPSSNMEVEDPSLPSKFFRNIISSTRYQCRQTNEYKGKRETRTRVSHSLLIAWPTLDRIHNSWFHTTADLD